jgi:uncharacterized membrane protein YkoI
MARTHLLAALILCCLSTPAVLAQGNSGGNANSNASSGNESNGRQSGQSDQGNDNSARSNTRPAPPPNTNRDEEEALRAVQSGQAVPLSRIVGVLERTNGAQVLDAKLVKAGNVLLYQLKLLLPNGTVATEFYHAPTGQRVQLQ